MLHFALNRQSRSTATHADFRSYIVALGNGWLEALCSFVSLVLNKASFNRLLSDNVVSSSNAFFYGLPYLTKHIVLYDTLLDQSTPEEVEAVLAHELGHWKFNHSLYSMLMSEVILVVNLALIRTCVFNPALVSRKGFVNVDEQA